MVLLHEAGHAVAALLTGGWVARIDLSAQLGGACWSAGGWQVLVLPAGYLGSMAFGGAILVAAARWRHDRLLAAVVGSAVLGLTLVSVRSLFGFAFGAAFSGALLASSTLLPGRFNDVLMRFLGLTSVLYAVIDIKENLVSRTVPGSDAHAMSELLFLPPVFWGVVWMAVAVQAAVVFLVAAARPIPPQPPEDRGGATPRP